MSYLPGLTAHGVGPAQNNIYVRGLATGDFANQAAGFNGSFPNVAIYLDEQSAQLPGRNLDVYAADLDRIEILEGSAGNAVRSRCRGGRAALHHQQAEARRHGSGSANAGYATTAHGDPSGALDAVDQRPDHRRISWRCAA